MFQPKSLRSKRGYQLPQPCALITSADNCWQLPLPSFHTALKIPQPNILKFFYACSCVRKRVGVNERSTASLYLRDTHGTCSMLPKWRENKIKKFLLDTIFKIKKRDLWQCRLPKRQRHNPVYRVNSI